MSDQDTYAALGRIEAKVDRMDVLLRGSDDGTMPGLVTRLDRIEQKESRRDQISIAVIVAVVGSAIASGWAVVTGGKT